MPGITKIQQEPYKRPIINSKTTGLAAAASMGLTLLGTTKINKSLSKYHKSLGIISGLLALLHIGIIEYNHRKYKKM